MENLQQQLATVQDELKAQRARFAALVDALPDGVMFTTSEGHALATNQLCRDLFGLGTTGVDDQLQDMAEAIQHHFRDPADFLTRTQAQRATGGNLLGEEFVLTDGRVVERRYVVLADKSLGHMVSFRDVTAQRQQEARIQELEQRLTEQREMYTTVLDQLKVEVVVFDAEHRYQYANAQCFKDAETREWVIGKNDFEYFAYRQRPLELATTRWQKFDEAVQTRTEVAWEESMLSPDGIQQIWRHFIPVFAPDGTLRMMVGTGSNLTLRRQAERKLVEQREFYEFTLNHIPCDIGVFDVEGRYLFVNATGIKDPAKREWVIGKDNFDYCERYGYPRALAEERHVRLTEAFRERRLVTFEETFDRPEGIRHQFRCLQPVFYPDGSPRMIVAYGLDITERVGTERALRHAKLAAESAVRAREIFLANMSHEIRTPMNAILGMSQLLAKTELAPDQDSYRQAITTSAEHLLVIINDILDLSKLEAGKMALEQVGFTPTHLLAEIEQTLHYKAEEKGLRLLTRVAPTVPRVLLGDPYRIRQVLLNLAGNSIKFTDSGYVAITCDFVPSPDGSTGNVMFRVADTGIGIEPEFVQHIFNEFSQQDSSVTRKFGGTGLGLSITRNLLKLMGSDIQLDSTLNKGTVMQFALSLPVGSTEDLAPKVILPADSPTRQFLRDKRVLLVEDNRFNRQIAKTFLSHAQVQVTEAEHGAIAVELAQHTRFDLILMDIQMPVMDGYAATALLRQQLGLSTPIVALTANAVKGEREKCLSAGMNGYLAKPFKEEELLRVVGDWTLTMPLPTLPPEPAATSDFLLPPAEPTEAPTVKLYGVEDLLAAGQGDLEFVSFMLETFVESCEEAMKNLALGMQEQNITILKTTAHTLKPNLVHLHALNLLPPVEALDQWQGSFEAAALKPLVDSIRLLLLDVVAQIRLDMAA
ncbi:response regulator [Hymenobacter negativus]|uniref:histidine kinase n=1 Tax=Hymenobacter negativus TaxID=2795026 RepID=A0ABS3QGJ1_9BACT|nr:response regulator [Hymenobacter negativus]MBO2010377.1 response regulator [Hymenobacter negativus]